jgi:hypothetical protein
MLICLFIFFIAVGSLFVGNSQPQRLNHLPIIYPLLLGYPQVAIHLWLFLSSGTQTHTITRIYQLMVEAADCSRNSTASVNLLASCKSHPLVAAL